MQLKNKKVVGPYDLWANSDTVKDKRAKKLHPSTRRNQKTPLPHPGQSYNPHPEDHKRLLQKVAEKEIEYQRKQASLRRALNIRFDAEELQESVDKDLVSGIEHLINKDDSSRNDSDATDDAFEGYGDEDFSAILKDKTVKEKRKSRQQRLKQLKDKLQRKAAKLRKSKNIRMSKFDAIKRITKELDKKEKEEAKKSKKRAHTKLKTERFGQRFEPSDPIYCLSDELPSNLLNVSCPMDKIVREQLDNFRSRLMLEPTSLQMKKRKFKKKVFDRKISAEQEG